MAKICLISSSGGHFAQLKQLLPIINKFDPLFIVEKNASTLSNSSNYKTLYLLQQERKNTWFYFIFITNIILSFIYILKERPKIIISTGAGAVVPFCLIGKLFGAKIIFIESFAKITTPTMTGKILYKFADQFYVQWESMLSHYPKAIYKGSFY
jgi:beta-1,4-N-acetylglucosaminyltransferase